MHHIKVVWKKDGEKGLSKIFESFEESSLKAIQDVSEQLFSMLSYTPSYLSFVFEPEPSAAYKKLRGCTSKKNYYTLDHAQNDADKMNEKRPNLKEMPYKCEFCGFFHVGAKRKIA